MIIEIIMNEYGILNMMCCDFYVDYEDYFCFII